MPDVHQRKSAIKIIQEMASHGLQTVLGGSETKVMMMMVLWKTEKSGFSVMMSGMVKCIYMFWKDRLPSIPYVVFIKILQGRTIRV